MVEGFVVVAGVTVVFGAALVVVDGTFVVFGRSVTGAVEAGGSPSVDVVVVDAATW
jgi:hypothetical protein